jgi:hypothetical protein
MTFFECYADEILLRILGFSKKNIEHSFGRSRVCSKLSKTTDAIGLIDEDPNTAREPYLKYLFSTIPAFEDDYLIYLQDKKLANRLIVVRPDLENWALKLARDQKIDLQKKYGLSNNVKELKELMLLKNGKKLEAFEEFLRDVSDHKAIEKIKELIK